MKSLSPCPECQRHVRTDEARCPFCGASCSASPALAAEVSPSRISQRAAAIAMSVSLAAAACGDPQPNAIAIYGAPSPPASLGGSGGAAGASGAAGNGGSSGANVLPEDPTDAGPDAADAALT
jgi:hypothetical protein